MYADPSRRDVLGWVRFSIPESKVTHVFVVKNTTGKRVKVQSVQKSCTCTSFELSKYQLRPGETAVLRMEVDVTASYVSDSRRVF